MPAQGKRGNKITEEIRLGVGGLRYLEIWGYKSNPSLLGKQHTLVPGLPSYKRKAELSGFPTRGIYRETREIKESDVFEYGG